MAALGFDAHTHLDFPALDNCREEHISDARAVGVGGWAIAGADPSLWERVVTMGRQYNCPISLGVHPWWSTRDDAVLEGALNALETVQIRAVGEIGLDYAKSISVQARQRQLSLFEAQVEVACSRTLPAVLHCVKAFEPMMRIVKAHDGFTGMIHDFGGSTQMVNRAISAGLLLSIGPRVLRSERLLRMSAAIPLESLLIETDAPERGFTMTQLPEVAAAIGKERGISGQEVLEITGRNGRGFFGCTP